MVGDNVVLVWNSPGNPPSINELNRTRSWQKKRRLLLPWREAVAVAWWQVRLTPAGVAVSGQPCGLRFTLGFTTARRRDPHNYVDSVVKACVDELVNQGVWPDDSPEWVSVQEPICNTSPGSSLLIVVRGWSPE